MIPLYSLLKLDLNRALRPIELIYLKYGSAERRNRLASMAYSTFFLSVKVSKTNSGGVPEYFFVKSLKRNDYDQLFYLIAEQCKRPKSIFDLVEGHGSLSFLQIARFILLLPLALKVKRTELKNWLFMYLALVKLYGITRKIPRNKNVKLVVFADMQPVDNIISQYANLNGQPTTTLQHGLYVDYGTGDTSNVNIVNYLNAEARCFLAWGLNTAKIISKYHPNTKTYLCGKPTIRPLDSTTPKQYFTAIFDQNLFFKYNLELLDIANSVADKLNLKINIRLHPNNKIEWVKFDPLSTVINEEISGSQFIIGHTSSLLYECMRVGIPTFKMRSTVASIDTPETLSFSSADELEALVKEQPCTPSTTASEYIQDIGASAEANYSLYFDGKLSPTAV